MKHQKLKHIYNLIKDNLSTLILIPTVLGGLWQLLELSSISISFIRFFSLSQLIPDGLLILFILVIFYLSYRMGLLFLGKQNFNIDLDKKPFSHWYGISLILICIFVFLIAVIPPLTEIYKTRTITLAEIAILIPCIMFIVGGVLIGLFTIFVYILFINKDKMEKWKKYIHSKKDIIATVGTLIILTSFLFTLKFILIDLNPYISNFRQGVLFPKNMLNKELLNEHIIKNYNLRSKPELIYFNDKYLFYEIKEKKAGAKILIIEFTDLVDSNYKLID